MIARLRAAGCVFAEDEAALLLEAAGSPAALEPLVARRVAGEPLEYVLGWVEFRGRRMAVAPGVFVPRRRSELLVEQAVAVTEPGAVVVELCCGCAAIGAALAAETAAAEVHAVDLDPAAVACARTNLPGGHVYEGDLDAPLPPRLRGRVDVLVCNAPYVPTAAVALMPPEAREHEPLIALDGGADGLDVLRRVVTATPGWLAPGGHLLVESSVAQAPRVAAAMRAVGLAARVESRDEPTATVVVGRARRP